MRKTPPLDAEGKLSDLDSIQLTAWLINWCEKRYGHQISQHEMEIYIPKLMRDMLRDFSARPQTERLREAVEKIAVDAVDVGERKWKEQSNCHESGCGCWTEWVKAAIRAALSSPPAETSK